MQILGKKSEIKYLSGSIGSKKNSKMNLKKEHSENNEYKAEINAMKRN